MRAETSFIFLDCSDLWKDFVSKKGPITMTLNDNFNDFYGPNDLSTLLQNTVIGRTYTMVLRVTSTCPTDVEIGLSGHGGWFTTNVPAYAKDAIITVTDVWKGNEITSSRLENRMTCGSSSITIGQIQLVKGPEDCLNGNG